MLSNLKSLVAPMRLLFMQYLQIGLDIESTIITAFQCHTPMCVLLYRHIFLNRLNEEYIFEEELYFLKHLYFKINKYISGNKG